MNHLSPDPGTAVDALGLQAFTSVMTDTVKGPASYFPSIEKKYGRPISDWTALVEGALPAKHMDLVTLLKTDHDMGHGHANAIVAHVLATKKA